MPPANGEPRDGVQEGDDFCSAVQWVVAQAGWHALAGGMLKSPCALSGHRVGTGLTLQWQNKHFPVLLDESCTG